MKAGYETTSKANGRRWAMINQCIANGVFEDMEHFRNWMHATFGERSTRALTPGMLRVLYMHLRYYLDPSKSVDFEVAYPWRINAKQKWHIEQAQLALGWDDERLASFLKHQLGVNTFVRALSRSAATKVITGMNQIIKQRHGK